MEYMEGGSLHHMIHKQSIELTLTGLLGIAMDVAQVTLLPAGHTSATHPTRHTPTYPSPAHLPPTDPLPPPPAAAAGMLLPSPTEADDNPQVSQSRNQSISHSVSQSVTQSVNQSLS